jgi:hypothetical protein
MNDQDKRAQQAAQMAQFNPFNIDLGGFGRVSFEDGTARAQMTPAQQQLAGLFQGGASNLLGGGAANQFGINQSIGLGSSDLGGAFAGAQQQGLPMQALQNFMQSNQLGQGLGFGGGQQALDLARQFGTSQTGINEGVAQGLFGQGFNALGNTDFSSLAADQLARSRQLARPAEERAVNSKFQNLFNRGALASTGGQRQVGELALAQEQADIGRQFGADQFANQLAQQNRQFGLSSIGQGLGARAQDQQFNLGAANLFGGMGQNLLNFGAGQARQGLDAQLGFNQIGNQRAQQRLANAQNMLGFGSQMQSNNIRDALGLQGGSSQMAGDLRNLIALGGNLGGQQSQAGAQAGNFLMQGAGSPLGEFLQGFGGSGLFSEGGKLDNFLGGFF